MATIISNSPVPGLKISKVGNSRKKKKKGGGLLGFGSKAAEEAGSLVRARAATSVLSAGASPAVGAVARAALPLGAKIFMGLMLGIAGFGVYSARQAFNHRPVIPAASPRVFAPRPAPQVASPQAEASPKNLPGDNQGYSSLNMVRTGLPEMQAPPAAPAQAAAAPPPAQPSSPAIPDMSALTQAAKAAKGGSPFDSKIGQLDSAMPSLSGNGPGLSGGVGMPFQKMNPPAFLQKPKPMAMAQTAPSMGMAHGAGFGGVGHAFSQARNAAAYGNAAANSNGAGAAYNSGAQFDSPIGQPATMGSPQGIGSGSGLLGAADANPSTNPNGSGSPSNGGGGGGGNSYQCSQDPCSPGCPNANKCTNPNGGGGTNVTPNQDLINIAQYLLLAATALVLIASIMAKSKTPWVLLAAKWMGYIGAAMAAAVAVIGTVLLTQGQYLQGAMFALGGAALAYGGYSVGSGASDAYQAAADQEWLNGDNWAQQMLGQNIFNSGSFDGSGFGNYGYGFGGDYAGGTAGSGYLGDATNIQDPLASLNPTTAQAQTTAMNSWMGGANTPTNFTPAFNNGPVNLNNPDLSLNMQTPSPNPFTSTPSMASTPPTPVTPNTEILGGTTTPTTGTPYLGGNGVTYSVDNTGGLTPMQFGPPEGVNPSVGDNSPLLNTADPPTPIEQTPSPVVAQTPQGPAFQDGTEPGGWNYTNPPADAPNLGTTTDGGTPGAGATPTASGDSMTTSNNLNSTASGDSMATSNPSNPTAGSGSQPSGTPSTSNPNGTFNAQNALNQSSNANTGGLGTPNYAQNGNYGTDPMGQAIRPGTSSLNTMINGEYNSGSITLNANGSLTGTGDFANGWSQSDLYNIYSNRLP